MSLPRIVAVAPGSPAARAGLVPGDEVVGIDGRQPRDVLEWRLLVDDVDPELEIRRGGLDVLVPVPKRAGEALGAEVHSSVFDRVRTCDNHCEFCFIYQLPKGMRRSLYLKDDDYRLSFLYGNFTTLTRFTEADLERVIDEGLSPLHVSIHATDPEVRVRMLRNRRGATSLRWLRALLDNGITVHGQIVVCPGVNDGDVLDATLAGVLDEYPELASLCVVPLGISAHNPESSLRPHTVEEAAAVVGAVESWQSTYLDVLGRRLVFASDEYYLLAHRPFPEADAYEGFAMHEDGVGMARLFAMELAGEIDTPQSSPQSGFFSWVDGAPAEGYRATRVKISSQSATRTGADCDEICVLTGEYGARVLEPLLRDHQHVRVVPVPNEFFGGTTAVTGLMVGADVARVLQAQPEGHRYLLPDVCLSQGRFLDGTTPDDLPRPVEIVPTDGVSLRKALVS
jgi:putative radical SAM enzyme (TIGR03279 family)